MKKKIAILGSTGSIGMSTLEVINKDRKNFDIFLLSANNNYKQLIKQAKQFKAKNVLIKNHKFYLKIKNSLKNTKTKVYSGDISIKKIVSKKLDYTMSAVVDDHLMNISHVIRGDDHKINTVKQKQIYEAMKWQLPEFAHIPLIHSASGKKLSKRDKASTLNDYIKIGILPEALRNYLLRLGWSYKDKEIFTLEESIQLFNLSGIGKSPSKLDMDRILSINEHYIKNMDEKKLYEMLKVYSEKYKKKIDAKYEKNLINSIHFLKNKAKKLEDIYKNAQYVLNDNIQISPEDLKLLDDPSKSVLKDFLNEYEKVSKKNKDSLEKIIKGLINKHKTNFKGIGQPLRIALTGSKFGPAIYDILLSLDKNEVVKRLKIIK